MIRFRARTNTAGSKRQILFCLLLALSGFIVALWLNLPLAPLLNQAQTLAGKQGLQLEITGPGRAFPFGLQAEQVQIGHRQMEHAPIELSEVDIRPLWGSLFSSNPGLNISADLFAGNLVAAAHSDGEIELELNRLQLRETLKPKLPLEIAGTLTTGTFSGRLPLAGKNQGKLELKLDDVALLGLKEIGGAQDRLSLGSIRLQAESRGSLLQISQIEAIGGALEIAGSGTLSLGRNPASSRLALSVILKPTDLLDPGFRDLLSLLGQPGRDGAYRFRLTGPLNAIQMR
jgi:type II secretion system protein N